MSLIKFSLEIRNAQTHFVVLREVVEGATQFFVAFANTRIRDCFNMQRKDNIWHFLPPSDDEIVFSILLDSTFTINSSFFQCFFEKNEMDKIGKEILRHVEL